MYILSIRRQHLERLKQDAAHLAEAQDIIEASNLPWDVKERLHDLIRDSVVSLDDIVKDCQEQEGKPFDQIAFPKIERLLYLFLKWLREERHLKIGFHALGSTKLEELHQDVVKNLPGYFIASRRYVKKLEEPNV